MFDFYTIFSMVKPNKQNLRGGKEEAGRGREKPGWLLTIKFILLGTVPTAETTELTLAI